MTIRLVSGARGMGMGNLQEILIIGEGDSMVLHAADLDDRRLEEACRMVGGKCMVLVQVGTVLGGECSIGYRLHKAQLGASPGRWYMVRTWNGHKLRGVSLTRDYRAARLTAAHWAAGDEDNSASVLSATVGVNPAEKNIVFVPVWNAGPESN